MNKRGSPSVVLRGFWPAVLSITLTTACSTLSAAEISADVFTHYEIVTGVAAHETILTGFLSGGNTAELVAVHSDASNNRRLKIFGFDGSNWNSLLDAPLSPEILMVDVVSGNGNDRLIAFNGSHLVTLDPTSAAQQTLLELSIDFRSSEQNKIPSVDISRDLNQDGLDDLVIPDLDGFWISLQSLDGSFSIPIKLGPPEPYLDISSFGESRSYRDVGLTDVTIPSYLGRMHSLDYNRDDRHDLAFWNGDHFDIHLQDLSGQFISEPETVSIDVAFDADGLYALGFLFPDEGMFSLVSGLRASTERTVLHSFNDTNGDGIADLITQSLQGRSLLSVRSSYAVHFGSVVVNGIEFASEASMVLQPQANAVGGSPIGYSLGWLQDLDGDDQVDFIFGRVNTGVTGFFRAIVVNSITIELEYYRIENGKFPAQPNGSLLVKPDADFVIGGRGPFFPTLLLGDVSGDGRTDLMVGENWEALDIYSGVAAAELFATPPQRVAVSLTANEQNARSVDLNGDGKHDVLLHHPSSDTANRLLVLIAR